MAAIRTKDSYLAAQYRRLKPRRGHAQALGAVKHSIIFACWHMLTTGELYHDLGGDYLPTPRPRTQAQRLVAQLERLGTPSRSQNSNGNGPGGCGSLSVIFLSVFLAGCAGDPGRVKMLDDPGVVR